MDLPSTWVEAAGRYEAEHQRLLDAVRVASRRWLLLGYVRGSLFLALLAAGFAGWQSVGGVSVPWYFLAGALGVGFLIVAYFHEGDETRIRRARMFAGQHVQSIARCRRNWSDIQGAEVSVPKSFEAVATDLDLVSEASLFRLLGTVHTETGRRQLADWMATPAPVSDIESRQAAVDELKPEFPWREQFQLDCQYLAAGPTGPDDLIQWATSDSWLDRRTGLLWLARVIGLAVLGTALLVIGGLLSLPTGGVILMVLLPINFLLAVFYSGPIHEIFNKIASRKNEVAQYQNLFRAIDRYPAQSEILKRLQSEIGGETGKAMHALNSLSGLVWMANLRRHGVLFLAYLFLQFCFFWDIHVLYLLRRWKAEYRERVAGWFDAFGEWESLTALSKLAADHPEWPFPSVRETTDGKAEFVAEELGHPLMPNDQRVCNDVRVGPPGTVLLVTGSNMSGKSTLLRAIGVNAVLAQMGSVVCARSLTMSPVHLETSMRIHDSLADGVSFFMAELNRLKQIVDLSRFQKESGSTMLYLLDEILQGTNSRERHIAVEKVVEQLIENGAIGAVSTHDLELATADGLQDKVFPVHFTERFFQEEGQDRMTFDYKMRSGVAPTTNALKLLRLVGLDRQ